MTSDLDSRPLARIRSRDTGYSITVDDPEIGQEVEVVGAGSSKIKAKVEAVTDDRQVLWVAASTSLPRTAFLRQDAGSGWTSR